jgi:DHA1 family solute carrier family 18 vesicular amine transporter 1/2
VAGHALLKQSRNMDGATGRQSRAPQLVWPLYFVAFLGNFTVGSRVLIIPLDASHLGQSPAAIGLLYAAFAGVGALASLPTGLLIDRIGSRTILVGGLLIAGAAQLLAVTDSILLLVLSQVLAGVSWGMAQLSVLTASIGVSPPNRLGRVLGLTSLGNQTGLMAGPAVAGYMTTWLGFGAILGLFALAPLAGALIVVLTQRGDEVVHAQAAASPRSLEILRRPGIVPIALLAASIGVLWGTFQAFFAIFAATDLHLAATRVGALVAIAGVANALSRIPTGRLLDSLANRGPVTAAGIAAFAAGLIVMPHAGSFWLQAVLLALSVPFAGVAIMGMTMAAMTLGGAGARGRAIGVTSTLFSLATGVAPAVFGSLMNGSYATGFAAASLSALAIAAVALVLRRRVILAAARAPSAP